MMSRSNSRVPAHLFLLKRPLALPLILIKAVVFTARWVITASFLEWSTNTSVCTVSWTALSSLLAGLCSTSHLLQLPVKSPYSCAFCAKRRKENAYYNLRTSSSFVYAFCLVYIDCSKVTVLNLLSSRVELLRSSNDREATSSSGKGCQSENRGHKVSRCFLHKLERVCIFKHIIVNWTPLTSPRGPSY